MLASFGFNTTTQWPCLYDLWQRESGWNVYAENPTSGAYGIPQSLPGDKMATSGSDWQTNPATQIKWGLGYIKSSTARPAARGRTRKITAITKPSPPAAVVRSMGRPVGRSTGPREMAFPVANRANSMADVILVTSSI